MSTLICFDVQKRYNFLTVSVFLNLICLQPKIYLQQKICCVRILFIKNLSKDDIMSDFRDFYKNSNQLKEHQSQRRSRLLEQQRRQREERFAFQRDLKEILTGQKGITRANRMFKNNLMLSEWMMYRPDDIEDFLIKPCPKGIEISVFSPFIYFNIIHTFRCQMLIINWRE